MNGLDAAIIHSHPPPMAIEVDENMIPEPCIRKSENESSVIELSDCSGTKDFSDLTNDLTSDMDSDDSDLEVDVETVIKPLPLPFKSDPFADKKDDKLVKGINNELGEDNELGNVSEETAMNDSDVKFTKLNKSNQIGTPLLLDYQRSMEVKFTTKNPQIPFDNACVNTATMHV